MNRQKYDQEIKRIAQSGKIPFPGDFYENIMKLYESLPEEKKEIGNVPDRETIYAADDAERMNHVTRHLLSVQ